MLRTRPARFVKIMLNQEIMLDFGLKFRYNYICQEGEGKPKDAGESEPEDKRPIVKCRFPPCERTKT